MKLTQTRKAIKAIRGAKLRKDFEGMIARIEKGGRHLRIGPQVSLLIGFTLGLRESLPARTRFAIADSIFADAEKSDVPHQWERKEGYECGDDFMCSKANQDKNCYRDTWTGECRSG